MLVESRISGRGKNELNFNEWTSILSRKQGTKLDRIIKQVQQGKMPLKSYTMPHTSAELERERKLPLIGLNGLISTDNW